MMKHCYSNLFYNENRFKIKNPCAVNYNEEIHKLSNNSENIFQN